MDRPVVRLSCEQCRRRKTKCDKGTPCSACRNAGLSCNTVQRARLPRGRTGKTLRKGVILENRVAHIEEIVRQLETQIQSGGADHKPQHEENVASSLPAEESSNKIGKFIAGDFWTALSQEVAGLRETLERSDDEDVDSENDGPHQKSPPEPDRGILSSASNSGSLLFGHDLVSVEHEVIQPPPKHVRAVLLREYRYRVDSIFKVLHWPTVVTMIEEGYEDEQPIPLSPAMQALEFAIYFMALCSLSEQETKEMLPSERRSLLRRYRLATEVSLSRAGLFQKPDITVLQAFVIYLMALRSYTSCASTWTMLPVAIRIARALGLDSEDTKNDYTYDLELRRRLWLSIGLLDTQTSLDRGSRDLLQARDFVSRPLNINDSDMSPSTVPRASIDGFTDMMFSSITHEAMLCQKKVCEPSLGPDADWSHWNEKVKAIATYEDSIKRQFASIDNSAQPLERFTKAVGEGALVTIQLLLRRPLYRNRYQAVPPWDDFDVMDVATNVLESSMKKQELRIYDQWAWFSWLKWYALAVVLAELCTNQSRNDRAYSLAERTFSQYAGSIADSDTGMLWKPMSRLMRRVRQQRQRRTQDSKTAGPLRPQTRNSEQPRGLERLVQDMDQTFDHTYEGEYHIAGSQMNLSYMDTGSLTHNGDTGIYNGQHALDQDISHDYSNGYDTGEEPWLDWNLFLEEVANPEWDLQ